jgi:hypothetical protein
MGDTMKEGEAIGAERLHRATAPLVAVRLSGQARAIQEHPMTTDAIVWHAVIRDADGTLRCMDPGCGFNRRGPGDKGPDMRYHRASDLQPALRQAVRRDGPERRMRAVVPPTLTAATESK